MTRDFCQRTSVWMLVAIVGAGLSARSALAQVSVDVLRGGADTLAVDPGEVALELDFRVTSSVPLSSVQWALIASDPALFVYDANSRSINAPFSDGDAMTPAPAEDVSLDVAPDQILFKVNGADYAANQFPASVMTLRIRSNGELPDGTYTFVAGDSGNGLLWGSSTELAGAFDSTGVFTLVVGTGTSSGGDSGDGTTDPDPGDGGGDDGADDGSGGDDGSDDGVTPDPDDPSPGDGDTTSGDGDDDGGTDDGTVDDGSDDSGTGDPVGGGDDGSDDSNQPPVVTPGCGAGLVEAAMFGAMFTFVQRRRRQ